MQVQTTKPTETRPNMVMADKPVVESLKKAAESVKGFISDEVAKCLPNKCGPRKYDFFNEGEDMVNRALQSACDCKCPDRRNAALKWFSQDLRQLSKHDLEQTRDYIVAKMDKAGDPDTREFLLQLYQVVDKESERRSLFDSLKPHFPPRICPPKPWLLNVNF